MSEISDLEPWHSVHIATPFVRAGRRLIALAVVFTASFRPGTQGGSDNVNLIIHGGIVLLALVYGFIEWRFIRWRINNGTLQIESGVVKRNSIRFPLDQIQAIDTVRSGLARVLGVSELRLRMAGNTGKEGRLAYLKHEDAEIVRARLLALAHGLAEHIPEPPEQILLQVRTERLIGSIVLSGFGAMIAGLIIGIIVLVVFWPGIAIGFLGGSTAFLIGLGVGIYRRFNNDFRLTVAEAPDGLRLRSGLVETTAETIPRGRIQAIRMVEPLAWRIFGWCRVEVSVAGRQRRKGENKAESRSRRAVLPVGTKQEASWLISHLISDAPNRVLDRAPIRVRFKAPFSFHFLGWQRSESCAITTHGRLNRITDWVPLEKVQSLRVTQGPLQRRFRVADIHLDTAGSNVYAEITDRDESEIAEIVDELVEKCQRIRSRLSYPTSMIDRADSSNQGHSKR